MPVYVFSPALVTLRGTPRVAQVGSQPTLGAGDGPLAILPRRSKA